MQITKENINIKSFSMKKIKRTGGKMLKIENILKINRGPFLSTIIPKNDLLLIQKSGEFQHIVEHSH